MFKCICLCLVFLSFLMSDSLKAEEEKPTVFVLFGASGDLAARKLMPALYQLSARNIVVVGVGRRELSEEAFRLQMRDSLLNYAPLLFDEEKWAAFCDKLYYHQMEFDQNAEYKKLQETLQDIDLRHDTSSNRLYYLATPPSLISKIIGNLKKNGFINEARKRPYTQVLIEKPFGYDFESAMELQKELSPCIDEEQIFRVDHYLAKLGVLNFIQQRQNGLLEEVWNKQHVESIHITLSEQIGVETVGAFWEETGYLRNIFQNHLMQLLAVIAMEPAHLVLSEAKLAVFNAMRPFPNNVDRMIQRKQYEGYRHENQVNENSHVETFLTAKLFIDNPRWQDVPFYVSGGKRLAQQEAKAEILFKNGNRLLICFQPHPQIVFNGVSIDDIDESAQDAYEKLIADCMKADHRLFVTFDEQIACWKWLEPVIKQWSLMQPPEDYAYPPGAKIEEIVNEIWKTRDVGL